MEALDETGRYQFGVVGVPSAKQQALFIGECTPIDVFNGHWLLQYERVFMRGSS